MRRLIISSVFAGLLTSAAVAEVKNPLIEKGSWPDIKEDIIENYASIQSGESVLLIEAPTRAHDAAVVPIKITQTGDSNISNMTLVVDENPAPMAARFEFGESMGPIEFETRVRVDQYSNFRTIAETSDGDLWMAGRFIKASGGCSAPASKDAAIAEANRGKMKVKHFVTADLDRKEAQVMIRHPNYSGLQRDQVTHLFVPANFIDELEVFQGEDLLFKMEGGISISENPTFRFKYNDNGADGIRVRAIDTDGNIYQQVFAKEIT